MPNAHWQAQNFLEVKGVEAAFSSRMVLVSPKTTGQTLALQGCPVQKEGNPEDQPHLNNLIKILYYIAIC